MSGNHKRLKIDPPHAFPGSDGQAITNSYVVRFGKARDTFVAVLHSLAGAGTMKRIAVFAVMLALLPLAAQGQTGQPFICICGGPVRSYPVTDLPVLPGWHSNKSGLTLVPDGYHPESAPEISVAREPLGIEYFGTTPDEWQRLADLKDADGVSYTVKMHPGTRRSYAVVVARNGDLRFRLGANGKSVVDTYLPDFSYLIAHFHSAAPPP